MERAARTGAAVGQEAQVRRTVPLEARPLGTPEAAVMRSDDNTRLAAVAGPDPDELTARIFRALTRSSTCARWTALMWWCPKELRGSRAPAWARSHARSATTSS
jgi:hypothetical protein